MRVYVRMIYMVTYFRYSFNNVSINSLSIFFYCSIKDTNMCGRKKSMKLNQLDRL